MLLHLLFLAAMFPGIAQTPGQSAEYQRDPQLEKSVSFEHAAVAAPKLLKDLATASGCPIAAATNLESDVLLVRVSDVPLKVLMEKLSYATGASWVPENGVYYLSRTAQDLADRARRHREELVAIITANRAKAAREKTALPPVTPQSAKLLLDQILAKTDAKDGSIRDYQGFQKLFERTPTGQFANAIASALPAEMIADAPEGRRTVFSTSPTSMERPLPLDVQPMLGGFLADQAVFADAAKGIEGSDRQLYHLGTEIDPITSQVGRVEVVVDKSSSQENGFQLKVSVRTGNGHLLASGTSRVQTMDDDKMRPENFIPKQGEPKLAISQADKDEMTAIAAGFGQQTRGVTLSPETLNRFRHPDQFEPLGGFVSSLLSEASKEKNFNLVADVPDCYIMLGPAALMAGAPTATSFLKLTSSLPPTIAGVEMKDGWLEIAGGRQDPVDLFTRRSSRPALAELLGNGDGGGLSLEGLAKFADQASAPSDDFMFMVLTSITEPSSVFEGTDRWAALRLVSALMKRPGGLPHGAVTLGALDPASLDALRTITFDLRSNLGVSVRPRGTAYVAVDDGEPCDILPNGLPPSGTLTVIVSEQNTLYTDGPHPQATSANAIAMNTYQRDHPSGDGSNGFGPSTADKFRLGKETTVAVFVEFGGGLRLNISPVLTHRLLPGPAQPFGSLSEEVQSAVKKQIAQLETQGQKQ